MPVSETPNSITTHNAKTNEIRARNRIYLLIRPSHTKLSSSYPLTELEYNNAPKNKLQETM